MNVGEVMASLSLGLVELYDWHDFAGLYSDVVSRLSLVV